MSRRLYRENQLEYRLFHHKCLLAVLVQEFHILHYMFQLFEINTSKLFGFMNFISLSIVNLNF